MSMHIVLASGSEIRQTLLRNAGVEFTVIPARIDEESIIESMIALKVPSRDIADNLAEMKAIKVGAKNSGSLVIGCDQILSVDSKVLVKAQDRDTARNQLICLRGRTHELHSAAVVCEGPKPVWRKVTKVNMTMRSFSDQELDEYLDRNWPNVSDAVGAYKLEEEGVRLFSAVQGDYFSVLGLPLLDLLSYLTLRGDI